MTPEKAPSVIEAGDPADSKDAFRRALGHFATGVTIITAEANGAKVGVTANSFNSVSLQPPLVLWSISKNSTSWPIFEAARSFTINVLASDQIALSAQFAKSGTDKFKDVAWQPGHTGAPVLDNAAAHFECERFAEYEGGDHWIVVGRVVRFARLDRRPLIFNQGRYGLAIDHNEATPSAGGNAAFAPRVRPTFLTLFRRAFLQRSNEFRQVAQASGFTVSESRLMYHLEARPGLTSEELARVSLMEPVAATDSIAALIERRWMTQGPDGVLALTAEGLAQNDKLRQVAYAQEGTKLAQFSAAEIETALKVLATFGGTIENIPDYEGVRLN